MSRLEKPLSHQTLWSTGDIILRAFLDLELKDSQGNWHTKTFRVDSAADMTTIPAREARLMGIPMPQTPAHGLAHEQTGLEIRSGVIRCQIVGMDQTEYAFPCFFLGDPSAPLDPNTPLSMVPRYLLGLSGVADKVRWEFNATPDGLKAPHGYLIVEKI